MEETPIKPVRIQCKRTKGFNLQAASPNGLPVVCVGRPTKWGNPFRVSNGDCDHPDCGLKSHPAVTRERAIATFADWLKGMMRVDPEFVEFLRGKNLACWCKIGDACHADVLLEISNGR